MSGRRFFLPACSIVLLLAAAGSGAQDQLTTGRTLAMDRAKGNCLACHAFDNGELAGTIGPPLVAMRTRFPDRATLFHQIWDATERNTDSRMPPFGRHGILTDEEIESIVDYLYTL